MKSNNFLKNSITGLINIVFQNLICFTNMDGGLALLDITINALNYSSGNIVQPKNTL